MVARTKPPVAASVRIATATRSGSAEPGRAGALRLALLSLLVAALVGGAAYLGARSLIVREAIDHLDALRASASRSLAATLGELRRHTSNLAEDPRAARALRD